MKVNEFACSLRKQVFKILPKEAAGFKLSPDFFLSNHFKDIRGIVGTISLIRGGVFVDKLTVHYSSQDQEFHIHYHSNKTHDADRVRMFSTIKYELLRNIRDSDPHTYMLLRRKKKGKPVSFCLISAAISIQIADVDQYKDLTQTLTEYFDD